MLQAKLKNGKTITPAMFPRQKLLQLKAKKEVFYCPACKEEVILRAGEKVIAHFAHAKEATCPSVGGGEGVYHEQGKLILYEWLTNQGIKVELEAYLPELKQRPDFLIHHKQRRIAIEYQCSKIPSEQIIQRTEGYHQAGIHVVWILGERLMKRRGTNKLQIDTFTQRLIHQFSSDYPLSLFYFCPLTRRIIKFQDFTFTGKTTAFGRLKIYSIDRMTFPKLLEKQYVSRKILRNTWKQEKKYLRLKRRRRLAGEELNWHRWLYENGLHVEQLSELVHLPVFSGYQMKVPGWIWQSRIIYKVIQPVPIETGFTLLQCMREIGPELLPPNNFPLIHPSTNPILEYLQLLCKVGIIEQTSATSYKKLSNIILHHNLEDALHQDSYIIDTLYKR